MLFDGVTDCKLEGSPLRRLTIWLSEHLQESLLPCILRLCPKLEYLELSFCLILDDACTLSVLSRCQLPALKTLRYTSYVDPGEVVLEADIAAVKRLVVAFPALTELEISTRKLPENEELQRLRTEIAGVNGARSVLLQFYKPNDSTATSAEHQISL